MLSKTISLGLMGCSILCIGASLLLAQSEPIVETLAVVDIESTTPVQESSAAAQKSDSAIDPHNGKDNAGCEETELGLVCRGGIQGAEDVPTLKGSSKAKPQDPKTILDIQPFASRQTKVMIGSGQVNGEAELINLNTNVNSWYLLKILWPNKRKTEWFHLEAVRPKTQRLSLHESFANGLLIEEGSGRFNCDLWSGTGAEIKIGSLKDKPFTLICDKRLYLRKRIEGYRTTKEWVVEFLRDKVWAGEAITNLFKSTIYKDRYLIDSKISKGAEEGSKGLGTPKAALLNPTFQGQAVNAEELGIKLKKNIKDNKLTLGQWYEAKDREHIYVSVLEAKAIHKDVLESHKSYVKPLGDTEAAAVNYLIAFDLEYFDLNYTLGTEHPRVGWSKRVRESDRDLSVKGPDGFDSVDPLAPTGLIPPHIGKIVSATFTAGFKRSHGAFKWGKLAKENNGHHYGFIEAGVVFSKLQPNLATVVVDVEGKVSFKTWQEDDNQELHRIVYAQQNGVPVIDFDNETLQGVPGRWVSNWTMGNWSGSQDREFRTLRAGMCLSQQGRKKFLIYGYFSSVTPTAMARVFQAYGCDYALHLDMNALEHTYMALYPESRKDNVPQQLINGMKVLDERFKGNVPRFIGYPDNRDYFYLVPKGRVE